MALKSEDVQGLLDALETAMYHGTPDHEMGLRKVLAKLGIKNAYSGVTFGAGMAIEGLSATLKNITFDMKNLQQWKTDGGK